MHPAVQTYIDRIKAKDNTFTKITLEGLNLCDKDLAPLWKILAGNLRAAKKIAELQLSDNLLTTLPPLAKFKNLWWVFLNNNPLTDASKILLNLFSSKLAIIILYDNHLPQNISLTKEILNEHFMPKLIVSANDAIEYLKRIGATYLLSYLPIDLIRMLNKMLLPPAVSCLRVELDNFKQIINILPINPNFEINNESLTAVNDYEDSVELESSIANVENFHAKVLGSNAYIFLAQFNKFIRNNGFNQNDLSQKNNQGYTPLALAMRNDREAIANKGVLLSMVTPILRNLVRNDPPVTILQTIPEVTNQPQKNSLPKNISCCTLS